MTVCTELDSYVAEFSDKNAMWVVELSDGQRIYQDDARPGLKESSAWIRLRNHCKENDLHITSMRLVFRSHEVTIGEEDIGYYFCKGASGTMFGDDTRHLYMAGALKENGSLIVKSWLVPELEPEASEPRDPHLAGECLIAKHGW
jgi:hypothetical protein